ncbi:MAG: LrgB family protein [Bacteroidales bacterium]|nr:LrgB family protein [Bacteroidales bacterium]MCI5482919.1 LrgB family protein [Bacteroidales bacterium]MDY2878512.1 LrgB family protein [Candidatus Cryptobacteroides sp.]
MKELIDNSVYIGVLISLASYALGVWLRKKTGLSFFNPLLVSIILVILFLSVSGISYSTYAESADYISFLLTPATICLAVPLYEQFKLLKKNWKAVVAGIVSGVVSSLVCIFLMALLFRFDHQTYVTFLPKSITTAIGMGVAEELGGYVSLAVVVIVITGVLGNVIAEAVLKLFKIEEPIAKGIAIGSSSHAVGTAKAMEIGQIEGAMSSLSIVVCGLLTVIGASLFANFI